MPSPRSLASERPEGIVRLARQELRAVIRALDARRVFVEVAGVALRRHARRDGRLDPSCGAMPCAVSSCCGCGIPSMRHVMIYRNMVGDHSTGRASDDLAQRGRTCRVMHVHCRFSARGLLHLESQHRRTRCEA